MERQSMRPRKAKVFFCFFAHLCPDDRVEDEPKIETEVGENL